MKIYTKSGDHGSTKLGTGGQVAKADLRVEAYGTVDELSSFLGLALVYVGEQQDLAAEIVWIQRKLFQLASILAFPGWDDPAIGQISLGDLAQLEAAIDAFASEVPPLKAFILPGGSAAAAHLHVARSVCRRAERLASALDLTDYPLGGQILPFLNRLSDYLFTAARVVNYRGGQSEPLAKG